MCTRMQWHKHMLQLLSLIHSSSFLPYWCDVGSSVWHLSQFWAIICCFNGFSKLQSTFFSAVGRYDIFGLPTHHLPSSLPSSANLAILSLFIRHTRPSQVFCLWWSFCSRVSLTSSLFRMSTLRMLSLRLTPSILLNGKPFRKLKVYSHACFSWSMFHSYI